MGTSMHTTADGTVARKETYDLIASNKVEGTNVYDRAGERIGEVHNFMVDKVSGQAAYAVISFGGFLGIGEDYFPLPWNQLSYDTAVGGYVVDIDRDRLNGAPRYARDEETSSWRGPVDDYWARPMLL